MKKFLNIIKLICLIIWQLPQEILGSIFWMFLCFPKIHEIQNNVLIFVTERMRGGISLGNFIFVRQVTTTNILHELGHTKQSRILGPLYIPKVGVSSLGHAMFHKCSNYYHFWTEKWADAISHIKR